MITLGCFWGYHHLRKHPYQKKNRLNFTWSSNVPEIRRYLHKDSKVLTPPPNVDDSNNTYIKKHTCSTIYIFLSGIRLPVWFITSDQWEAHQSRLLKDAPETVPWCTFRSRVFSGEATWIICESGWITRKFTLDMSMCHVEFEIGCWVHLLGRIFVDKKDT